MNYNEENANGRLKKASSKNNTIYSKKRKPRRAGLLSTRGVLVVLSSNLLGRCFVLDRDETLIGRKESCDIQLNDPLVSKTHCAVTVDDRGKYFIEDLGSTNATFVNKNKVKKKTPLLYGDRIVVGNTILRFFLEESCSKK
ncbi:MAG: FHA domain-containing protein [Spirochaetota bacterium]